MSAPDRVISHAAVMAAFADLNRRIERQQTQGADSRSERRVGAAVVIRPTLHRVGSRQFCAGGVPGVQVRLIKEVLGYVKPTLLEQRGGGLAEKGDQ
ncbi:MAG: hypothetical protein QOC55_2811 [Thermoleophilaceae bacterium]|jgi:hypothetical protein|nr:hypothetical protein [Thermoleophilaceae bacterium]